MKVSRSTHPEIPHLLLPWDGFRVDVFSGVATAHDCGFSVTACRNQWVAHETCILGLSFASTAPPLSPSLGALLHTEAFHCKLTRPLTRFREKGSFTWLFTRQGSSWINLTHVCSASYVAGKPKAPSYRYKRLHKGNTTIWRA